MNPRKKKKLSTISAGLNNLNSFILSLKSQPGLTPEQAERKIMEYKPKRFSKFTDYEVERFNKEKQILIEELKRNFPTEKELTYNHLKRNARVSFTTALKKFKKDLENLMEAIRKYRPTFDYDLDDLNEIKLSFMKDHLSPENLEKFKQVLEGEHAQFEEKLIGGSTQELKPEPDNFSSQKSTRATKRAKLSSHDTHLFSSQSEELHAQESPREHPDLVSEEKTSMHDREIIKFNFLGLIKLFPGLMYAIASDDDLADIHSKLLEIYQKVLKEQFKSKFTTKQNLLLFENVSKIKIDIQDLIVGVANKNWVAFSDLKQNEFDALKAKIERASEAIQLYFQRKQAILVKKDGLCVRYEM